MYFRFENKIETLTATSKNLKLRNMLNKSQSNNPSMQVTEALHRKEKILPNFYTLDTS